MSAREASRGGGANSRTARSLAALQQSASTSRVLNLANAEIVNKDDPARLTHPFFHSRALNSGLIIKHRLRYDETYLFHDSRQTATKIIVPFSIHDLSLGGQSVFVDQTGWLNILEEVCPDRTALARDIEVLRLLDQLPSLDPFLLREHLRQHNYDIAACYFSITKADFDRMQAFVASQISKLISLAFQGSGTVSSASTSRLVEALLSTQVDARLDPLRMTLMLDGEAFREGVFCWKGFLYYKWVLANSSEDLRSILDEIKTLTITGPRDMEMNRYVDSARLRLNTQILAQRREVVVALKVYDDAFQDLTTNGNPKAFREFLLRAPEMFLSLGEKIGGISHVVSFWRYRFPKGTPVTVTIDDAVSILQDFESSLSVRIADTPS
jgi:hypothetical protein